MVVFCILVYRAGCQSVAKIILCFMKRATQNGLFGFPNPHFFTRGKVQGMVFYVRKNKQCVRQLGDMNAKRFWRDGRFESSRGAGREFGAAAMLSGAIRSGFGQLAFDVSPKKLLHNKLTKQLIHSFIPLPGVKGSRVLPGSHIAAKLKGFSWEKSGDGGCDFGHAWTSVDPVLFKPRVHFKLFGQSVFPDWVTHVQPVFCVVAVSDMVRRKNGVKYRPANRALHGAARKVAGPIVDVRDLRSPDGAVSGSWRPDLVFPEAVDAGMGLVTAVCFELIGIQRDGAVLDRKCVSMMSVWAGSVASSIVEARLEADRFEAAGPHLALLRGQKPLLVAYDGPKSRSLDRKIAEGKRRREEYLNYKLLIIDY